MGFNATKRRRFVQLLGERAVAALEAGLLAQGKQLMATPGINWKSLAACLGDACPPPAAAPAAAPAAPAQPASPAAPYVAQFETPATPSASVVAAVAELRGLDADPAAVYIADLAERGATS